MSTEMNLDEAITYLRPIAESATVGHYAEALGLVLAAAGVTQPEPEYEYGIETEADCGDVGVRMWGTNRKSVEAQMPRYQRGRIVRRVKAGAWEPVPNQTGETP